MSPRQPEARRPDERPAGDGARQRAIGSALVALGLAGMLLFGVAAGAMAASMPALLASSGDPTALNEARKLVADSAAALRQVDLALGSSAAATDNAAAALRSTAATLRQGADALQVDVFGQRPFGGVAGQFSTTADQADATARSVSSTSASITSTRAAIEAMIDDLDRLSTQLDKLGGGSLSLLSPVTWFTILAGLAWLFLAAAAMTWLGWLLRTGRVAATA